MTSTFSYRIARAGLVLFFISAIFLSGCKDDEGDPLVDQNPIASNNTDFMSGVDVSCDLIGFVKDINGSPVSGIQISVKGETAQTNQDGFWHIEGIMLDKNRAYVEATSPDYFHSSKIIRPKDGGSIAVYHTLIPLQIDGNFNSDAGGTVTSADGVEVEIPANGVVSADGSAYSGEVQVALHFLDTESSDYVEIIPGDFAAFDEAGEFGVLRSYSMAGFELRSPVGEELNLNGNASATITLPLANDMIGEAESTVPLWYFNEEQGYWQEEGEAVLVGNAYVGTVNHFSFWNADLFDDTVYLSGCLTSGLTGEPLAYRKVSVDVLASTMSTGRDFTDVSGKYGGLVPANSNLLVGFYNSCDDLIHSEFVNTTETDVVLDMVLDESSEDYVIFTGQLSDCDLADLSQGQLYVVYNNALFYTPVVAEDGSFELVESNCYLDEAVVLFIRESVVTTEYFVLNPDNTTHDLGDLNLCGGEQEDEFFTFTLDGQDFFLDDVDYSVSFIGGNPVETVEAEFDNGPEHYTARITREGSFSGSWATNETFEFRIFIFDSSFFDLVDAFNQQGQESVSITVTQEAEALGTYLEAEFEGTVFMQDNFTDQPNIYPNIPVSGSFRVLREW